jgi:malonate-semialdehyde dehydrogenase (acetylating)/methylmalonate-semialdehyde dehydrogenase
MEYKIAMQAQDQQKSKLGSVSEMYKVAHFINGQKHLTGERTLPIFNPAEGQSIGEVCVANQTIVNEAVAAAKSAFKTWSETTPSQRSKILYRFKQLLEEHRDELIQLVSKEHGKTISEAQGSLQRGLDVVDFVCGIPSHLKTSFSNNVATGVDAYSLYQPLGICVGITPFNFPAMIPLWMFPMAIACGNTFILKPSERDPSCSYRFVELAKLAGVPDGVINLVNGDKETVDALITHPDVKAVSFVGSSTVADYVYQTATTHHKRVQAFGGAKNHCIVMPDANLQVVADALVTAAYDCAGERCMAISVAVIVGDQIADQLVAMMAEKVRRLVIGPGCQSSVQMGPLVTRQHLEKVKSYIAMGIQEGAQLIVDGRDYQHPEHHEGFYLGGCLFDHVKAEMRIYKEEIFGPVLSVVRVRSFDEALNLINEHDYGNGTAIFTADGYTARDFVQRVDAGMVGINVPVPVPVAYHSFGGWKRSIFADIGMYGHDAVRFYTKLKTVTERWFAKEWA